MLVEESAMSLPLITEEPHCSQHAVSKLTKKGSTFLAITILILILLIITVIVIVIKAPK